MSTPALYDFNEPAAARVLCMSTKTLSRIRKAGRIGHYRGAGGRVWYTMEQLLAYQASLRVEPR